MIPLHEELKDLRLEKGITLETINDSMKISMTILEKMEAGDFSVVPKPFIRAFLREYAEVIGIDPGRVIARYENKTDSIAKKQPAPPERAPAETESVSEPVGRHKKEAVAKPETQPEEQEVTPETREKPESSGKTETVKKAASDSVSSSEAHERDPDKESDQSSPEIIADDEKVITTATTPHETKKAVSVMITDYNETVDEGPTEKETLPAERQRLVIEESGPMHTVSIVIFVIIIIVAAVVIFLINRG